MHICSNNYNLNCQFLIQHTKMFIEDMKMEAEEGERHTQREKERNLKTLPCCL